MVKKRIKRFLVALLFIGALLYGLIKLPLNPITEQAYRDNLPSDALFYSEADQSYNHQFNELIHE